ncbi:helix-turn-helix domain-containing protein [Virgibacillus soli]|uniref:helix-turn-helix domain-containing protein n=1 Tax=Paracerasibacillus soli TaxID=480284 RepID=UPI0035E63D20
MLKTQMEPIKRSTLTVHEVAEYLGVSSDMIYILCREKRIVHFRIGRRILFKKEAIEKWIDEQMEGVMEDE